MFKERNTLTGVTQQERLGKWPPVSARKGVQPGRSHLGQDWTHLLLFVPLLC